MTLQQPFNSTTHTLPLWQLEPRPPVQKAYWSAHEDRLLLDLVTLHGAKNWSRIAKSFHGRIGKQCRERWRNHLNPDIRKEPFSAEEDAKIIQLVSELGTKWTQIAAKLPGRSDNSIKNRFYSSLKRTHEQMAPGLSNDTPTTDKVDSPTPVSVPASPEHHDSEPDTLEEDNRTAVSSDPCCERRKKFKLDHVSNSFSSALTVPASWKELLNNHSNTNLSSTAHPQSHNSLPFQQVSKLWIPQSSATITPQSTLHANPTLSIPQQKVAHFPSPSLSVFPSTNVVFAITHVNTQKSSNCPTTSLPTSASPPPTPTTQTQTQTPLKLTNKCESSLVAEARTLTKEGIELQLVMSALTALCELTRAS